MIQIDQEDAEEDRVDDFEHFISLLGGEAPHEDNPTLLRNQADTARLFNLLGLDNVCRDYVYRSAQGYIIQEAYISI